MGNGRRTVVIHQPGMGKPHAQCVIDDIADRSTIAGAGEAVREAPVLQRVGDRPLAGIDIREHMKSPLPGGRPDAFNVSYCRGV